jgi:hypothetical protein
MATHSLLDDDEKKDTIKYPDNIFSGEFWGGGGFGEAIASLCRITVFTLALMVFIIGLNIIASYYPGSDFSHYVKVITYLLTNLFNGCSSIAAPVMEHCQ